MITEDKSDLALCQMTKSRLVQIQSDDFAGDKIDVNEQLKFGLGRVENIVGKGENAGYQNFLLFPQCFKRLLSHGR